jgi:succinyl-CoA synthetase alpha subunit
MAILIDNDTKLVVQGLTGREGSFHAGRNKEYGTNLVAGVTPGKGGTDVDGVPIYDTVAQAVAETGANTSMVFVPARFAADAVVESYDAGIDVIVAITENIPSMDMARTVPYIRSSTRGVTLIGPNCPGLISPGKANVGIIPGEICKPGPVGLVSRSGTLTYQIIHELTQRGIGQSTCVGIGGDPIPGSDFIDVLTKFEADSETELVVLVGEIGGDAEERAAAWIKANMSKPVVGYIAGLTAPPGKRMGHAGAIISGSKGTGQAKIQALEAAGIRVGKNPTEVAEIVAEMRGVSA